jgi:RND family efflux transporter MFP subunit
MSSRTSLIVRGVVPFVIIGLGVAGAGTLMALADTVDKTPPDPVRQVVDVLTVAPAANAASVVATGVVEASRRVQIVPQVGGLIVGQSDAMVPGGRFRSGASLASIDRRDYQINLRQAESQVRQAELEVQLEAGRKAVAEREWALLGDDRPREEAALALREPHGEVAATNLEAAQASRDRSALDLERTALRSPFNAMVLSETLEVGQVVSPGQAVATLIGTDRFWVSVSVGVDRLARIDVPTLSGGSGSSVTVAQDLGGGRTHTRDGRVVGLAGELDPATRTARVLVAIDDPLAGPLPLLPGAYVEVRIDGEAVGDTVRVPRGAVYDGSTVWVVDADQNLARKTVTVAFGDGETVMVSKGLGDGDQVVVSPLAAPLVGQPVTLRSGS